MPRPPTWSTLAPVRSESVGASKLPPCLPRASDAILSATALCATTLVKRVLVATDESATATKAVEWAAELAGRFSAELLIVHVVVPENLVGAAADEPSLRGEVLRGLAEKLAGARGRARLVHDSDPAAAIVRTSEEEAVDLIVVG